VAGQKLTRDGASDEIESSRLENSGAPARVAEIVALPGRKRSKPVELKRLLDDARRSTPKQKPLKAKGKTILSVIAPTYARLQDCRAIVAGSFCAAMRYSSASVLTPRTF